MAKGYVTLPVGYKRVDGEPLEANVLFTKLTEAQSYASTDPTAYAGQYLAVVESETVKAYIIKHDKTLQELASGTTVITSYNQLSDKPQIGGVELTGNKSLEDLGIQAAGDYATKEELPTKVSELENDSKFQTDTQVASTIESKISALGALFILKGRKDTFDEVEALDDMKAGDAWLVGGAEDLELEEYVYTTENKWEKLGVTSQVDLSEYYKKTEVDSKFALKTEIITSEERQKLTKIKTDGTGDKYLADNGEYKAIDLPEGTMDYEQLSNKPQINGVELTKETVEDNLKLTSKGVKLKQKLTVAGVSLGDIKDGEEIPVGTAVEDILNRMLRKRVAPTYTKPTLALNGTGTTPIECGTSQDITLTPQYTKNDGGEITSIVIKKGEETIHSENSAVQQNGFIVQEGNNTFTCEVNYGDGAIKNDNFGEASPSGQIKAGKLTANKIYVGQRKMFWQTSNDEIEVTSSDMIRALTGNKLGPADNTKVDIAITQGNKCVVFAYPASLGDVSQVMQKSTNLDVKGSFVKTTVNVEGANKFTGVEYNVYKYLAVASLNEDTFTVTI